MATTIQVVGNTLDATNRLEVKLDGGNTIEIPTIQSGGIAEEAVGTLSGPLEIGNTNGAATVDWLDVSSPAAATATCSSVAGRVAIDATATNVVVTNTKVGVGAVVLLSKLSLDGTLTDFKVAVNVAGGEFTITGNAAATADVLFDFLVVNVNDVTPE
jgi:hypothetical protein